MKKCNEFWGKMVGRYKIDDMFFSHKNWLNDEGDCEIITDLHKDQDGDEYYINFFYPDKFGIGILICFEDEVINIDTNDVAEVSKYLTEEELKGFIKVFEDATDKYYA